MPQVTVNGKPYELVPLNEMTLDEADIICGYAKVSFDQIPEQEGFWPGTTKGLLHVAVARGEPGESERTIREIIGRLKVDELKTVFHGISEEADTLPPPNEPEQTAPNGSSGGTGTPTGASTPESNEPPSSGSPGSATGAISDPRTLAA